MKIKKGVELNGLKEPMLYALYKIESIFNKYNREATITSAIDGKHSATSLHYKGLALDVRTRDLAHNFLREIVNEIRYTLGDAYDVVLEETHLHIEYDPKDKP